MSDNTKSIEKINEQIRLLNSVPEDGQTEIDDDNNDDNYFNDSDTLKVDKIDDLNTSDSIIDGNVDFKMINNDEDDDKNNSDSNFVFYIFIVILLIILCFLLYIIFK